MKIAICFFGITRSLGYTIASIGQNIIAPAKALGEVRVFAHFVDQASIHNPRSGEYGALPRDEHTLLKPDWLQLESREDCLAASPVQALEARGDFWRDDFHSLHNLLCQLHSLDAVTHSALAWQADLYVFARPDLMYHDSLAQPLQRMCRRTGNVACVPNWQHWEKGYNDRFAICTGSLAAQAYGCRITQAEAYCQASRAPLHAERLLRFALEQADIRTCMMGTRASRIRSDGRRQQEYFLPYWLHRFIVPLSRKLRRR